MLKKHVAIYLLNKECEKKYLPRYISDVRDIMGELLNEKYALLCGSGY